MHAPMCACRPQSAHRAHRTPMRGEGCARVLAARHDALATRLGVAMWTRPRAVRSAHSAQTSAWVGWGGGSLVPSAERETLSSHRDRGTVVERGGHVHVPPAKHKTLAPQQWHESVLPAHPAHGGEGGRTRGVFRPRNTNRAPGMPLGPEDLRRAKQVHTPPIVERSALRRKWRSWASA